MRNPFRSRRNGEGGTTHTPRPHVEESFIKRVWSAPADFNRAARRQARLWGSIWRWDQQALGIDPNLPPRYARRHWDPVKFAAPKTRRQRRHRARILRLMGERT